MNEELINCEKLLTDDKCKSLALKVRSLKSAWLIRGNGLFYTLGASAYSDDPDEYVNMAINNNMILVRHFGSLLQLVANFFERKFKKQVIFSPYCAVAGFHIFDQKSNGIEGHIHVDEPYTRITWPTAIRDPFTFTLPVELPEIAGIKFYPTIDERWFGVYDSGEEIAPPNPYFINYEIGNMYWHSGLVPHQIANMCDLSQKSMRITLQGHGVTLANDKIVIYF